MRALGVGLILAATCMTAGTPAQAQSDSASEIAKPIEQCVRDNAPAVEQAIPSLTDGVDFLVGDLCAKPVAEQLERERLASLAQMKDVWKKACETQKVTPKVGQTNDSASTCATHAVALDEDAGWTLYAPGTTKPAGPTALAAQILLQLRIQRMNATHTQGPH